MLGVFLMAATLVRSCFGASRCVAPDAPIDNEQPKNQENILILISCCQTRVAEHSASVASIANGIHALAMQCKFYTGMVDKMHRARQGGQRSRRRDSSSSMVSLGRLASVLYCGSDDASSLYPSAHDMQAKLLYSIII